MLSRALDNLSEGQGSTMLIAGAAGIGKTSLVRQLAVRAGWAGMPVLSGAASADLGSPAFWPWRQALSGPAATSCGLSPNLLRVAASTQSAESAAAARFATIERTRDGLTAAAQPAGLVLVLEDMHWADEPSLHLLDHICSQVDRSRLLVLVTARDPLGSGLGARRVDPAPGAAHPDRGRRRSRTARRPVLAAGGASSHRRQPALPGGAASPRRPSRAPRPRRPACRVVGGISRLVATRLARLSPPCRRLLDGAPCPASGSTWTWSRRERAHLARTSTRSSTRPCAPGSWWRTTTRRAGCAGRMPSSARRGPVRPPARSGWPGTASWPSAWTGEERATSVRWPATGWPRPLTLPAAAVRPLPAWPPPRCPPATWTSPAPTSG